MLLDAQDIEKGKTIHADVCIVGAGAAGITIARELTGSRISVCLLESGGFELEPDTQSLYEGESAGTLLPDNSRYTTLSRLRFFGGTTNHWGGWCRPLDLLDFQSRPWVPESGWPFGKKQLDPFYEKACEVCQVAPFHYDEATLAGLHRKPVAIGNESLISTQMFHQSPPTRFGVTYRDEITRASNIKVILHANVVELVLDAKSFKIEYVKAATLSGNRFQVKAKLFVLATGGLENARLLLLSNKVQKNGIGNHRDQVGRYFMDHPHVPVGRICLGRPREAWDLYSRSAYDATVKATTLGVYRLNDEAQRCHGLLNGSFTLIPLEEPLSITKRAYKYFFLSQKIYSHQNIESLAQSSPEDERMYQDYVNHTHLWESVAYLSSDIDALFSGGNDFGRVPEKVFLGILFARTEQAPNPASRVMLARDRDKLGNPRLRLAWNLSAFDKEALIKSVKLFALEFGRAGLGRVQLLLQESSVWPVAGGGFHHIGTTRMHDDPEKGVVDRNCRVHGVPNLFITGSSVFPTSGYANPTLTIVALAIRLSEYVKRLARA